jgi:hypothetical protein
LKPKYIIKIEMLPDDCVAYKNGRVVSCSFNKTFGSNSGRGFSIERAEEFMDNFRRFIRYCKEYDGVLERNPRTNEYPSRKNMIISIAPEYKDITERDIWNEVDRENIGCFQSKLEI